MPMSACQSLQWFRQSASVSCCILGRIRPAMECYGGNSAGDWIRWINTSLVQLRCFTILIKRWSSRDQAVARNRWWMAWWKMKCMFDIFWHCCTFFYDLLLLKFVTCLWNPRLPSVVCLCLGSVREKTAPSISRSEAMRCNTYPTISSEQIAKPRRVLQTHRHTTNSYSKPQELLDCNGFHMY